MRRHSLSAVRHARTYVWLKYLLLVALTATAFRAQVAFEVASIKKSQTKEHVGASRIAPEGRVSFRNVPLKSIIQRAYNLENYRLRGGPSWIQNEGYDIEAKPAGAADRDLALLMLQRLLADRCKLQIHHETAVVSGYELVTAKPGKMKVSDAARSTVERSPGGFIRGSASTGDLARIFRSLVNAPVEDRTALPGRFEIELKFAAGDAPSSSLTSANDVQLLEADPIGPLFSAVRQQLGLRLKPAKVSVDVIVIDHIERPSAN